MGDISRSVISEPFPARSRRFGGTVPHARKFQRPILFLGLAAVFVTAIIVEEAGRAAVGNPPELVLEEIGLSGDYYAIYVEDDLAYTVTQGYIQILDVSDPSDPEVVSYGIIPDLPDDFWVEDLVVRNGFAYVAMAEAGLRAFYVGQPASIVQVWDYGPEEGFLGNAMQLDLSGERLFVAANSGLYIFDLANPASPAPMIRWTDTNPVVEVLADGNLVYTGCKDFSLLPEHRDIQILDVSDPAQPAIISEINLGIGGLYGEGVYAMAIAGDQLYIGHGPEPTHYGPEAYLHVIDVSDPSTPEMRGSIYLGGSYGDDYEIAVDFPRLYFSNTSWDYAKPYYSTDFAIIDVSNPDSPVKLASAYFYHAIFDMFATENVLFAGGRDFKSGTFPIWETADIDEIGLPAPQDMVVEEGRNTHFYDGFAGLEIVPGDEPNVSFYEIIVPPTLELFDRFLFRFSWEIGFWSNEFGGVSGYDAVNAPDLSPLDFVCDDFDCGIYQPEAVTLGGDRMYVRNVDSLVLFDFSNSQELVYIHSIPFEQGHTNMAAVDGILFAGLTYGFEVIDFSDPFNPVSLALEQVSGPVNDLVLIDDLLYLAAGYDGLVIFDVSDPANPAHLGELATPGTAEEVIIEFPYAFVADGPGGLRVIDISDPASPTELAYFDHVLDATQVAVDRSRIWLLDPDGMTFVFLFGHSVLGSVHDMHWNPIPGAELTSDNGSSQTTSWTGNYSIDFLDPGEVTITPSFGNHVFYPAFRTATVPPDAAAQTFIMLGEPASVAVSPALTSTLIYTDTQGLPTTAVFAPGSVAISGTAYLTPTMAASFPDQVFAYHAFDLDFPAVDGCPVPVELAVAYSALDQATVSEPDAVALWRLAPEGWLQIEGGVISMVGDDFLLEVAICQPGRYALFGPSNLIYFPVVTQ